MFSWQSKYRSTEAKSEPEKTLHGIAIDSDDAIYWFEIIKITCSAVKMKYLGYANNATYHDSQDMGEEGSQYLNFESLF